MEFIQILIGLMCFSLITSQDIFDSDESVELEESEESEELKEPKQNSKLISLNGTDYRKAKSKSVVADESIESENSVELSKTMDQIELNVMKQISDRMLSKNSRKNLHQIKLKDYLKPIKSKKIKTSKNIVLPSIESCGLVRVNRTFQKIVGGKDSEIGAWPWMALLGYDFFTITFMCSGALVTTRHVITAAHCINEALTIVRLGEHDLSTDAETQHLDINITKMSVADFNIDTGRNDLAILVLEKTVEFTDLISPICIPLTRNLRSKSYVGKKPFVAGWGHTKENGTMSAILQELQTTVLTNNVCYESFLANNQLKDKNQFDESVICVGDTNGGKDTCQGDSGGPLMMPEIIKGTLRYFLIGVVSQGIGCARKDLAGSYTNVPYYRNWIIKNLH